MPRLWSVLARVEAIWVSPKKGRRTSPGNRPSLEKQRNETDKPDGIKDSSFSWRHKGGKEPQEEKKIDRGPPVCSSKKEK